MKKLFLISFIYLATTAISFAQVKVLPNGNVGIKTITPARSLHVRGSAVFTSGTTISSYSPYIRGKNGVSTASLPEYSWINDSTTGIFHPAPNVLGFSIGGSEKMRVHSNGCLGVGTISPSSLIDAQSTGTTTQIRAFNNNIISSLDASFLAQNKNTVFALGVESAGYGYISIGTPISAQTKIMKISNAGNICIGDIPDASNKVKIYNTNSYSSFLCERKDTTSFSYNMVSKVYGPNVKGFAISYNNNDQIYMYGSGDIYARNFIQTSDLTLKENINNIAAPLIKVLNLHGVTYDFKREKLLNHSDTLTAISSTTPKTEIGLLAQEVEKVVPEAVWTNENGIKGINYGSLVGLLVEAIKEQNATITQQGKEIIELRKMVEDCCKANPGIINNK